MHPTIQRQLVNARTADLHRQAEHDRLARAVRQVRQQQEHRRCPAGDRPASVFARRLYALLPARPVTRPRAA